MDFLNERLGYFLERKIAVVFPGQGSQYIGMGKDLLVDPHFRKRIKQVADTLQMDVDSLFHPSMAEDISRTEVAQPFIFGMSIALYEMVVRELDMQPAFFAGHSLGEFSALVASQSLSYEKGLELVKIRSQCMQQACERYHGTMAAIMGLEVNNVQEICAKAEAETGGTAVIANYNSKMQLVISGDIETIELAMKIAVTYGALKVVRLKVNGAFHSPLFTEANDEFKQHLSPSLFQTPLAPVVMNVSGLPIQHHVDIYQGIKEQMISPVLWKNVVETLITQSVELIVEIGPNKVLTGLIRSIDRSQKVWNVNDMKSFKQFIRQSIYV